MSNNLQTNLGSLANTFFGTYVLTGGPLKTRLKN